MLCQKDKQTLSAPGRESLFRDAASLKATMQGYHREFHRNPELSMQEFGTCHRIKQILSELGISICPSSSFRVVLGLRMRFQRYIHGRNRRL